MCHARCVSIFAALLLVSGSSAGAQTATELNTATRVYEELVQQFRDGRVPPELEMASEKRMVASFNAQREAIVLEMPAFSVARSMGADSLHALAYLLAHELAHYYGEHDQRYRFRELFSGLAAADSVVAQAGRQFRRQEQLQFEMEADLKAGFAAYLAGFDPLPSAPVLLRGVYREYGIDTARVGSHPPLSDRLQITELAGTMLDDLVQVFESGVSLLVIGRYEEAARVFDHLSRAFPSREMLSNAGTARALHALALLGDDVVWAYPIELDVDSRLTSKGRGLGFADERAERLLREAQSLFEQARLRDPSYLPALVNLATINQLLDQNDFALAYAEHALKLAEAAGEEAPRAHALIVRGIAHAEAGNEAAARSDFQAAAAAAPSFSRANLEALQGGDALIAFAANERTQMFAKESVAGIGAEQPDARAVVQAVVQSMGEPDVQLTLAAAGDAPEVGIYAERLEDSHAFVFGDPRSSMVVVLSTADGYSGTSARGIRKGSSLADVREAYGDAGELIATRRGAYHVYREAQVAFAVNADQTVTDWLIWYISE